MMEFFKNWFEKNNIQEVECLFDDFSGMVRGKIMPTYKFLEDGGIRLPEVIFGQAITGDWGDWEEGVLDAVEMDMDLHPEEDTIRFIPWAEVPTAQIIHSPFRKDGEPCDLAPRNILKRILGLYEAQGWFPVVAPELEFYFVHRNENPRIALQPPTGRSGRIQTSQHTYNMRALEEMKPVLDTVYKYCHEQELDVDTLIHESGPCQMEINFMHGNALNIADQVFRFKRAVKEAADRHNLYATFMAKPMKGKPGSSMHVHQSIVDKNGKNIFVDVNGKETPIFRHFIGGMQKFLPALMPIYAPNVNSYRRFGGESAPISTEWGYDNRTVGLRVPSSPVEATRIENRVVGADTNPYLVMAATLASGYVGMMKKINPRPPVEGSAYDLDSDLPAHLDEAVWMLEECKPMREILGERFVSLYCSVKEKEVALFEEEVTSWEREHLLRNV
jgi:glutamine synthetase